MKENTQVGELYLQLENQKKILTCSMCIHKYVGDRVDLFWNLAEGTLTLAKSQSSKFLYDGIKDNIEVFKGVHFRHPKNCPLENQNYTQNPQRKMKGCSCILLFDKKTQTFLITKRAHKKSLGNAWLLPGGHLQLNQSIVECAIRECEEEVGLSKGECKQNLDMQILAFQNPYVEDGKIKKGGIILYLSGQCPQFDVKALQEEVSEFHWKKIDDKSDEVLYNSQKKEGYGQGFLNYLKIFRQNYKK